MTPDAFAPLYDIAAMTYKQLSDLLLMLKSAVFFFSSFAFPSAWLWFGVCLSQLIGAGGGREIRPLY